ncbi:MAG: sugar phosphate isomerase/epimerase [Planctomycetota bacterium]|nr:sugar phosphate isomerase/epimerase [Planctomycetota bacterium]MDA1213633.1 sugar phosphate isomerase/epimerase [Planctomycetota bacterium]
MTVSSIATELKSKLSFSTLGCPDWSWRDLLDKGTEYGFAGVEIRLLEREVDLLNCSVFQPGQLAQRRRELQTAGFRVCGLASSVRFHDPGNAERHLQLETGRRYLDLANELGAEFVRVFGDVIPEKAKSEHSAIESMLNWIAEGLDELGAYAESVGQKVIIETHGDFAETDLIERLMRKVSSPAVGVLWDTHHPWRFYCEQLHETIARLKPWTMHTHWKDSIGTVSNTTALTQAGDIADQQARHLMEGHRPADYVLMGEGEFPTSETLRLLIDTGYTGWLSLEWEKMWHPEIADPETAFPIFVRRMQSELDRYRCL